MASQLGQRLVFKNAKAAINRAGLSPASAVLSQSFLRFEVELNTSKTNYTFDTLVNENTNPQFVTQNKLNLQDAFVVSEIGFFWADTNSVGASNYRLYSFDDQTTWSGTDAWGIYNGSMTLNVNQRTILTGWDLDRHYFAGNYQTDVNGGKGVDQLDLSGNGFYPAEPNIVMVGSKKNILQVVLPQALQSLSASGKTRLICIFRGILAQNVTPVN
jgi:hypothetical protein